MESAGLCNLQRYLVGVNRRSCREFIFCPSILMLRGQWRGLRNLFGGPCAKGLRTSRPAKLFDSTNALRGSWAYRRGIARLGGFLSGKDIVGALSFAGRLVHALKARVSRCSLAQIVDRFLRRSSTGSSVAFLLIWTMTGGRDMV
jgi:hypothetical protein